MATRNDILKFINEDKLTEEDLVSILILIDFKLELHTLSGQAKKSKKTRRGVLISNNFRKIKLTNLTLVTDKLRDTNKLPF